MLKLIHSFDMNFESVVDYCNSFKNGKDIPYFIYLTKEGKNKYFDHLKKFEKNTYFLVDSNNENYIVGSGSINNSEILDYHLDYLNEGNIGYGVRLNERNKGYGNKILELLSDKCKDLGMEEVCISCRKDNLFSKKIILNNGGIFEKEFFDDFSGHGLKYWIKLDKEYKLVKKL